MAHKWASWLHHPCRLGGTPNALGQKTQSKVAHKWANWLHHRCRPRGPQHSKGGDKIRNGPHMGTFATLPVPLKGSQMLDSRGPNRKWPKFGRIVSSRIRGPHRLKAGDKIRSGPQMGGLGTSPMPSGASPTLHSGGRYHKWARNGGDSLCHPYHPGGFQRFKAGTKSDVAHKWADWIHDLTV